MIAGIIHNTSKDQSVSYVRTIKDTILRISDTEGIPWTVLTYEDGTPDDLIKASDIVISVGGDGTFLKTASRIMTLKEESTPVLGFNLGTLGLLTECESDNFEQAVSKLIKGEYFIEDRRVLKATVCDESGKVKFEDYALNDCVIERASLTGVAYLELRISGNFVDNYPCDGIVIATQTGSTAYSMSAGGPIVEPGNDVTVVTPVCAHFTDGRPIVAKATSPIEISLCREHPGLFVTADGHSSVNFGYGDRLFCSAAEKCVKIIRIDPPNFYVALRNKAQERRRKLQHEI